MQKIERNSRSLSFDLACENKENEVLAALNKTEIELHKINKYLYEDYKTLSNITQQNKPNFSNFHSPELNVIAKNDKNEKINQESRFFCSPRFIANNSQENQQQKNACFRIIKKEDNKAQNPIESTNTFTLNDCPQTQSSDSSKKILSNESPIQTFQMRGTPEEKQDMSQISTNPTAISNKKNEFMEVSNNNFEEISEIQMIENMELDSFKLNEKSTLKGTPPFAEFNCVSNENNEFLSKNITELTILLGMEKEKSAKLQEKLENKDRLLNQMKIFHNELQTTLKETQKELDKQTSLNNLSDEHGKLIKRLSKENQDLKKKLIEKDLKIEAFLKEKNQNYDNLNDENFNLIVKQNKKLNSEIEILKSSNNILEKEKKFLKSTLEENQDIINDFNKEKEILIKRIENLTKLIDEKEKAFQNKNKSIHFSDYSKFIENPQELSSKKTKQFINSLTQMVISISPKGYFEEKPCLKQIWKFIKKVLEDYMIIKNELSEKNDIIGEFQGIFATDNHINIVPILKTFIGEYDAMGKIINLIKKILGIENQGDNLENIYEILMQKCENE